MALCGRAKWNSTTSAAAKNRRPVKEGIWWFECRDIEQTPT
jgi:hypothetical protein